MSDNIEKNNDSVDSVSAETTTPGVGEPTAEVAEETNAQTPLPPVSSMEATTRQDINIGENNSELLQMVNEAKYVIGEIKLSGEDYKVKPFSFSMASEISLEDDLKLAADFLPTSGGYVDEWLDLLKQRPVLVIIGDDYSGRYASSRMLAHRLREDARETLSIPPLGGNIRIDIGNLIEDSDKYGKRILIFRDALTRNNRDLRDFLKHLDISLFTKLKSCHTYLIFVTQPHALLDFRASLEGLEILVEMPRLDSESLNIVLDRWLKSSKVGQEKEFPDEQKSEVISRACSIPRLQRFLKYFEKLIKEGKKLSVAEAFQQFDNLPHWFLVELSEDFEAWCFAFVAALMQCSADWEGVPWTEFEELKRVLIPSIRSQAGMPRHREQYYHKERLADDTLLVKADCIVKNDPDSVRDVLKFSKPNFAERLWLEVLLRHNRSLLVSTILPVLIRLSEQNEAPRLRMHAARIIGRIGEIDYVAIIYPCFEHWSKADNRWQNATVGYLLEGARPSQKTGYWRLCLAHLHQLSRSARDSDVQTAISAYKQIGFFDLSFAMKSLSAIAEYKLADKIGEWQKVLIKLRSQDAHLRNAHKQGEDPLILLLMAYNSLRLTELAFQLFGKHSPLFYALQYNLTALCITISPLEVFDELGEWLEGKRNLRSIVVLILLLPDGIASEIANYPVALPSDKGEEDTESVITNLIVYSLASEDRSVERMIKFLEKVFAALEDNDLQADLANYLQNLYFYHLFQWLKSTAGYSKGESVFEELFVLMLRSARLRKATSERLGFFSGEGGRLEKFADVVKRKA